MYGFEKCENYSNKLSHHEANLISFYILNKHQCNT